MRYILLPLALCAAFAKTATAQEFTHVDVVAHGTRIEFVLDACGDGPDDADNQLQFCDAEGNLGIVRESFGLMDRGVRQVARSGRRGHEVYVTRFGVSLYNAEFDLWVNVPNVALASEDGGAEIQTALVNGSGDLVLAVAPDGDIAPALYVSDGSEGFLDVLPLPDELPVGTSAVGLVYDPDRGGTWVVAAGFFVSALGWYPDGGDAVTFVTAVESGGLRSFVFRGLAYAGDRIFTPTSTGLALVDVTDGTVTRYDASETQVLPYDNVLDVAVNPDGTTAWVASGSFTEGAVSRVDLATGTAVSYTLPDARNPDRDERFIGVAAASATDARLISDERDGLFRLVTDDSGAGAIEPLDTASIRRRGGRSAFGWADVTYLGDERYAYGAAVPTDNIDNGGEAEVVIEEADGGFAFRSDDAPGNFSQRMSGTQQHAFAAGARGAWYVDAEGVFKASFEGGVRPGRESTGDFTYYADETFAKGDGAAVTEAGGLLTRRELTFRDEDIVTYAPPRAASRVSGAEDGIGFFAPYGDEVWGFRAGFQASTIEVYADGALRARYEIADELANPDAFCVDESGVAWLLGAVSGGGFELLRFDPDSGEAIRETPTAAIGDPFAVEPVPGGGIYVLGEDGVLFLRDGQTTTLTSADDDRVSGLRDAAVDVTGTLHLSSQRSRGGYLTIEGLAGGTPAVTEIMLEELLPLVPITGRTVARDAIGDTYLRGGDSNPSNFGAGGIVRLRGFELPAGFRPEERGSVLVIGRVFVDRDGDGVYTRDLAVGEGVGNVTLDVGVVRAPGDTLRLVTVTNAAGQYTVRVPGRFGATTVTVAPTSVPALLALDSPDEVRSVTLPQNPTRTVVSGPAFELVPSGLSGIYVQTVDRSGLWGFERDGFRNAYTIAITNLDPRETQTSRDVELDLIYYNESPDAPALPDVTEVRLTPIQSLDVEPLSNYLVIDPLTQAWGLPGVDSTAFEILPDGGFPQMTWTYTRDTVRVTLPQLTLPPFATIVYEVITETADPTGFNEVIGFGVANVRTAGGGAGGGGTSASGDPVIDPPPSVPGGGGAGAAGGVAHSGDLGIPCASRDCSGPDAPRVYLDPPMRTPVRSSYDPNDKNVAGAAPCATEADDPSAVTCVTDTPLEQRELVYTIRFENEGNFSAQDVVVVDTLDAALDASTVRYLGASDVAQLSVERLPPPPIDGAGDDTLGVVTIELRDIFLDFEDDSNDGYVRFGVSLKRAATEGLAVSNRGSIYFDQNPPIRTNEIVNRFSQGASNVTAPVAQGLHVYPNPARGAAYVTLPTGFGAVEAVRAYDAAGRAVPAAWCNGSLDVGALAGGVYVVEVLGAGGLARGRLVVE